MTTPFHEVWYEAVDRNGNILRFEVAKVGRVMFTLPSGHREQRRSNHFRSWEEANDYLVAKLKSRIASFERYLAQDKALLVKVELTEKPEC